MILLATLLFSSAVLTNAADLAAALAQQSRGRHFDITAIVTFPNSKICATMAVADRTGATSIRNRIPEWRSFTCHPGEILRMKGITEEDERGTILANCESIHRVSRQRPIEPSSVSGAEVLSGKHDNQVVRLTGTVREVFTDEIDPGWIYFIVNSSNEFVYVVLRTDNHPEGMRYLCDADITFTGLCLMHSNGSRKLIGRILHLNSEQGISVVKAAPENPFAVPAIDDIQAFNPTDITKLKRHRLCGTVLSIYSNDNVLLQDIKGHVHRVELLARPDFDIGDFIEVVGLPETDLFNLNLSSAIFRKLPLCSAIPDRHPILTSANEIMTDHRGYLKVKHDYHAKLIRLRGLVYDIAPEQSPRACFMLKSERFSIPVDLTSAPSAINAIRTGCQVEVTGTCIVKTDNWRPYSTFPHTNGIVLAIRTPQDITILSRPSWWTPTRLLIVICSLLASLVAIVIWNRILNRLVERRSRQLQHEQRARLDEKLKVGERTRLAVELHDSLSQTLTGVSFQIDAAEKARQRNPSQIKRYLDVARQTLLSCREELKNCLWDLRNNALEEADAEAAVIRTVEPHVGESELSVVFAVQRKTMSDNTFHAILRILRELAANATRHGHAQHIAIVGKHSDGKITVSVDDDGCGFDPNNHVGAAEGHFGLLGVSERIETLGGTLDISSAQGTGTHINISIPL